MSLDETPLVFEARMVTYDRVDDLGAVWLPGSLSASLHRSLPPVMVHHVEAATVGRLLDWHDDDEGPVARVLIDPRVSTLARIAAHKVRTGVWPAVSVSPSNIRTRALTDADRDRWANTGRATFRQVITAADIDELSICVTGRVPGARILRILEGATL